MRGDLIETYKILTFKENLDCENFFEVAKYYSNLRGNSRKYKKRSKILARQKFFSQRIVNFWNVQASCQQLWWKLRQLLLQVKVGHTLEDYDMGKREGARPFLPSLITYHVSRKVEYLKTVRDRKCQWKL